MITRWNQLAKHGKTTQSANEERDKDVTLKQLAEGLVSKQIGVMDHLTKCSKAKKFHFNSTEKDLELDLDELINDHLQQVMVMFDF